MEKETGSTSRHIDQANVEITLRMHPPRVSANDVLPVKPFVAGHELSSGNATTTVTGRSMVGDLLGILRSSLRFTLASSNRSFRPTRFWPTDAGPRSSR